MSVASFLQYVFCLSKTDLIHFFFTSEILILEHFIWHILLKIYIFEIWWEWWVDENAASQTRI